MPISTIIVIPTYNEKDNILLLAKEIFRVAPGVHILIVDDNSPDGTGKIADQIGKEDTRVSVLHRKKKPAWARHTSQALRKL